MIPTQMLQQVYPRLSYSLVNGYLMCGKQTEFKRIKKLNDPSGGRAVQGTAVHGAAQDWLRSGKAGNILDFIDDAWVKAVAKSEKRYGIDWKGEDQEVLRKECNFLVQPLQHALVNFDLMYDEAGEPMIEKKIEFRLPGIPVPIVGYIDLVGADGVPVDMKVSGRKWSHTKAYSQIQADFYVHGMNDMGILNPLQQFRHLIIQRPGKRTAASAYWIDSYRTPEHLSWMKQTVEQVWKALSAGIYNPSVPDNWLCSPKWCSFYAECRNTPQAPVNY